ncbi:MAG: formate dehydrogenase subunit delta [Alphaproteobacteria bacterium]|nr:formate dehydrogenase subunit delta [Alphaproteobacteria bacterium]
MSHEKLVHMANQIGKFFAHQGENAPVEIATHLRKFWAPSMRAEIVAYLGAGGQGLDPQVRQAIEELRK